MWVLEVPPPGHSRSLRLWVRLPPRQRRRHRKRFDSRSDLLAGSEARHAFCDILWPSAAFLIGNLRLRGVCFLFASHGISGSLGSAGCLKMIGGSQLRCEKILWFGFLATPGTPQGSKTSTTYHFSNQPQDGPGRGFSACAAFRAVAAAAIGDLQLWCWHRAV